MTIEEKKSRSAQKLKEILQKYPIGERKIVYEKEGVKIEEESPNEVIKQVIED